MAPNASRLAWAASQTVEEIPRKLIGALNERHSGAFTSDWLDPYGKQLLNHRARPLQRDVVLPVDNGWAGTPRANRASRYVGGLTQRRARQQRRAQLVLRRPSGLVTLLSSWSVLSMLPGKHEDDRICLENERKPNMQTRQEPLFKIKIQRV
jgi:hypothetical protein